MLAKSRFSTFINDLVVEVQEAQQLPVNVVLRNENGQICRNTEKKICTKSKSFKLDGLNDLPYGVYTLECSQGEELVAMRMVKRV